MNDFTMGTGKTIVEPSSDGHHTAGPRLLKVTDQVFVGHRYSISNIIYIITATGVVVVDTGETIAAARKSLEDFRRICALPISYIIYTHFHGDHILGASALHTAGTRVIAQRNLAEEYAKGQLLSTHRKRVDRLQFGLDLKKHLRGASHQKHGESGFVRPDITFDSDYRFEDGGVQFELYHAPGESSDHVAIWLPEGKILLPGDLFYSSFPMLSSPMKPDRPVLAWAESLDRMKALGAQYLVPSHGLPTSGTDEIEAILTNYSGAIRYVHDRTVGLLNRGFSLEEIRQRVRLPVQWRKIPYLEPRYGSVDWAVRGIFRQYTGWYDLNPTNLNPLPRGFLSRTLVDLCGVVPLIGRAQKAVQDGDDRLCLELTDILLKAEPRNFRALSLRLQALEKLGDAATNRVERNLFREAALAVRRQTRQNAKQESQTSPIGSVKRRTRYNSPVIILAAPRSFTSVVCAMLGQHPQMYGMPELHLFGSETVSEWFELCQKEPFPRAHGLLRAVAQLCFDEQTEESIRRARGWLRARSYFTTGDLLRTLATKVYPATIVDKSPGIAWKPEWLKRALRMFPRAKFIHLVRHPVGQGESIIKYIKIRAQNGPIPPSHWLLNFAWYGRWHKVGNEADPQYGWQGLNSNIRNFLRDVPEHQQRLVRGEDLLLAPNETFRPILEWLELRSDVRALDRINHPEDSPYAFFGPPGAEYGNDILFLKDPVLRRVSSSNYKLEDPVSWLSNGGTLAPGVINLAKQFGYT
jgi:glyoxylase-like metal-dependent hydrolase (beta-lactamase superfamily II)